MNKENMILIFNCLFDRKYDSPGWFDYLLDRKYDSQGWFDYLLDKKYDSQGWFDYLFDSKLEALIETWNFQNLLGTRIKHRIAC